MRARLVRLSSNLVSIVTAVVSTLSRYSAGLTPPAAKSSSRKGPTMGVDPKVSCEVGPCPDPLPRGDRGKRPVQDGGVARVLIHASGGTQLCCQKAVGRQSGPRTGQERGHRVSTRSLDHMAPPVDHLPVGGGAQLLVSMLDDAVLQPGLSG